MRRLIRGLMVVLALAAAGAFVRAHAGVVPAGGQ